MDFAQSVHPRYPGAIVFSVQKPIKHQAFVWYKLLRGKFKSLWSRVNLVFSIYQFSKEDVKFYATLICDKNILIAFEMFQYL